MPERRVAKLDLAHTTTLHSHNGEQDRPFEFLVADELVPPCLPIALNRASAVNIDVATTKDEEGGRILILQVERIGLPVCEIVGGEREGSLDVEVNRGEAGEV